MSTSHKTQRIRAGNHCFPACFEELINRLESMEEVAQVGKGRYQIGIGRRAGEAHARVINYNETDHTLKIKLRGPNQKMDLFIRLRDPKYRGRIEEVVQEYKFY